MARLLKDTCELAAEILDGKHDADLDFIAQAIKARTKNMWRVGSRVKLVGTRNVEVEGLEGVIFKVNTKTISVGIGSKGQFGYEREFNVPTTMLQAI